jgi:serine protease Do
MSRPASLRIALTALASVSAFALGAWTGPDLSPARAQAADIQPIAVPNWHAVAAKYAPAVVGITTEGEFKTTNGDDQQWMPFNPDDPFFKFFRRIPMPQQRQPVHGLGSGFIISRDGLIITNAHVVRGASEVTVKLADHREFKAKVLGADRLTDVAVIKIDAHDLVPVDLGNSDELAVGDYVMAIGQPFGLEESATAGIVSATGRSLPGENVRFIQTDAAVNPGNSGGPLFDAAGHVVGINSQIYSQSGGYEGLAFAVPINTAIEVKDQIVSTGHVAHARLGVTVQPLTQALADSFHIKSPNGALVSSVVPDSAADKAGLRAGDVIIKVDGKPVVDSGDLASRISMHKPGDKTGIEYYRDGRDSNVDVKLAAADEKTADAETGDVESRHGRIGLVVRPLSPDERRQAKIPSGLLVEDVKGPAARAGIQPGDVVLSVNGVDVKNAEQLRDIIKDQSQVALLIEREGNRLFIPVPLGG